MNGKRSRLVSKEVNSKAIAKNYTTITSCRFFRKPALFNTNHKMKKIYILPGYEETTRRRQYQKLRTLLQEKGYEVVFKNINWKQKLTQQMFEIEKDSIVFGFSLGAVLARLVVQKYSCEHAVFASMTILNDFKKGENREALIDLLGTDFVDDVRDYLKPKHKALKQTIMYGDREGEEIADVLVKNTEHELTNEYLKEIIKLV